MRKLNTTVNKNFTQPSQAAVLKTPPGKVLDGFIKQARPQVKKAAQEVHRGAQKSSTLMRQAVKKPVAFAKSPVNLSPVTYSAKNQARKVRDLRLHRANTIKRSPSIAKFGPYSQAKTKTSQTTMPLAHITQQPQPSAVAGTRQTPTHQALPTQIASASHQQLERLLDHALHKADAHKKALHGRLNQRSGWRRIFSAPRWISVGSGLLVVFLLGGFFAWQNIPQVSMKLAAQKANFNATVPGYTPPGFSFSGPIAYTDRAVVIHFTSNTGDDRNFKLTQEPSSETSTSLAANTLANDTKVQTSQVNGTTIYIYDEDNHATWVNHGIRYTIEDNARLNAEQLLKIADSVQ